jgi:hypothetical protein
MAVTVAGQENIVHLCGIFCIVGEGWVVVRVLLPVLHGGAVLIRKVSLSAATTGGAFVYKTT